MPFSQTEIKKRGHPTAFQTMLFSPDKASDISHAARNSSNNTFSPFYSRQPASQRAKVEFVRLFQFPRA